VKKQVVLGIGGFAVLTAAASATLVGAGVASSDPTSGANPYSVIGEPYGKAVAILKSQGVRSSFGGSIGSDVPQAQCIVSGQKATSAGKMILELNCTQKAYEDAQASTPSRGGGASAGVPGAPNVGANGVTTVTPTPVGPQPGMSIPGA
jgi:hypothetical protein